MTSSLPFPSSGATFDTTGHYRYHLWRGWGEGPRVAFILLNPSTADATRDDPTVRRCIGFARSWGYGRLDIVNLFAYRATSPAVLRHVPDPIGPDNDRYLVDVCQRADRVVAAWGNGGRLFERATHVCGLIDLSKMMSLGTTQQGQPRHPLYLRRDVVGCYVPV